MTVTTDSYAKEKKSRLNLLQDPQQYNIFPVREPYIFTSSILIALLLSGWCDVVAVLKKLSLSLVARPRIQPQPF